MNAIFAYTRSIHLLSVTRQGSGILHWNAAANSEANDQSRMNMPTARTIRTCNLIGVIVRSIWRTDILAAQRLRIKNRFET